MYKRALLASVSLLLAACSAPRYDAQVIEARHLAQEITIVKDNDTRPLFLATLQEWCLATKRQCTIVNDGTDPNPDELTLTYASQWSHDFRDFISAATIQAKLGQKKVGSVEFIAPNNDDFTKFGYDEKRIEAMIRILFGEKTVEEAAAQMKAGDI